MLRRPELIEPPAGSTLDHSLPTRGVRSIRAALISMIVTIVFGFAGLEILGRIWFHNPFYYWEQRYLYLTPDSVRNVANFSTYTPDTTIEEVGIYQTSTGRFFEEFRCKYQVDSFGFPDNPPSNNRHYDILLLGDSFTQGQAGCSWVGKLRTRLPQLKIYNAGLNGTNFQHWAATKDYLEQKGFSFDKVIVIFIGDDFYRHFTQWSDAPLQCLHDIHRCSTEYIYPLAPGADLIDISRRRARMRDASLRGRLIYFWKANLWVSYFLYENLESIFRTQAPVPPIAPEMTAALARLVTGPPPAQLVRVWQKDETALRADNARSLLADDLMKIHGIAFDTCDVGYDNYLQYDGHPNAKGYERLADCIAGIVSRID